jgi:hypothetical protein
MAPAWDSLSRMLPSAPFQISKGGKSGTTEETPQCAIPPCSSLARPL